MIVDINDYEFRQLAQYIKSNYGIHLKEEKKTLLVSRLQQVLYRLEMSSFSEYYHYLIHDHTGEAATSLVNHITTNHTYFMRESSHFSFLQQYCLPSITTKQKEKDLRIWCAACSSGEEAYTIAMILEDYFSDKYPKWDKKLLATDISTQALEKAISGRYSTEAMEAIPPLWRTKYFKKTTDDQFEVTPQLKQEIIFRKFNLMSPSLPFRKKFHIIFCRNVMIYFDTPTKERLIQQFYEATELGGYLFLGHSESIDRDLYGYQYIQPSIYRKL